MCVFSTALQSCSRGGSRIVEDMCYKRRRAEAGLVCPSRTSERGEKGDCVKEGGGEEGERERERALGVQVTGSTTPRPSILRLIRNRDAAALAAAIPTLLFKDW